MPRDVSAPQLVFQLGLLLGIIGEGITLRRDRGASNSTLIFTTLIEPPFAQRVSTGTDVELAGFIPDLVHKLARRMRRPYTIRLVSVGGYGVRQQDGSWNGMIGDVISGVTDIAVGALSINPDREQYVDFTIPYMQSGIATVVKKPRRGAPSISSPLELANQTAIGYGVIPASLTYNYFRYSNSSSLRAMWEYMVSKRPTVFEWTSKLGVDRVRRSNGTYAFMVEKVFAEYLINQKPCDLTILDYTLHPSRYAFAVQKGSALRYELNEALQALKQNGVVQRLYRKWWRGDCTKHRKKGRRKDRKNRKEQKLSVQELPESDSDRPDTESDSELWISFIDHTQLEQPNKPSTTDRARGLNDDRPNNKGYDSMGADYPHEHDGSNATPNKRKDTNSAATSVYRPLLHLQLLVVLLLVVFPPT